MDQCAGCARCRWHRQIAEQVTSASFSYIRGLVLFLRKAIPKGPGLTVVIMDNAGIHRSKTAPKARRILGQEGIVLYRKHSAQILQKANGDSALIMRAL